MFIIYLLNEAYYLNTGWMYIELHVFIYVDSPVLVKCYIIQGIKQ